jgi:hypothetical protein
MRKQHWCRGCARLNVADDSFLPLVPVVVAPQCDGTAQRRYGKRSKALWIAQYEETKLKSEKEDSLARTHLYTREGGEAVPSPPNQIWPVTPSCYWCLLQGRLNVIGASHGGHTNPHGSVCLPVA